MWEKPVRISHWLMFFAFIALSFTGLYMHRPFLLASGRASFLMARMRFVHVVSGFVLIAAIALRVYWFFKGNFWSRWSSYVPIHREQWKGMGEMLEFYLFMRFDPGRRVGHNPLAAFSYADHLSANSGRDSNGRGSCTARCWGIRSCISSPTGCRCSSPCPICASSTIF